MKKFVMMFFIFILLISFFWFVDRAQAYQVQERWDTSVDPPAQDSSLRDQRGYKLDANNSNVVYDDEGNGVDQSDVVVDVDVKQSTSTFYLKAGVSFYKVIYKKAVFTQGVGFTPVSAVEGNVCREFENEYVKIVKIAAFKFDLQRIISSGDVVDNVVGFVSVCLSIDFVEFPSNVEVAKVYVNNVEIKPSVYGETHILSIPAGQDFVRQYQVKIVYYGDDMWKEHILKNKIEVSVKWSVSGRFELGYQGMDLVSWCVDQYRHLVKNPGQPYSDYMFESEAELRDFCTRQYGSVKEYIYVYDVAEVNARAV